MTVALGKSAPGTGAEYENDQRFEPAGNSQYGTNPGGGQATPAGVGGRLPHPWMTLSAFAG